MLQKSVASSVMRATWVMFEAITPDVLLRVFKDALTRYGFAEAAVISRNGSMTFEKHARAASERVHILRSECPVMLVSFLYEGEQRTPNASTVFPRFFGGEAPGQDERVKFANFLKVDNHFYDYIRQQFIAHGAEWAIEARRELGLMKEAAIFFRTHLFQISGGDGEWTQALLTLVEAPILL